MAVLGLVFLFTVPASIAHAEDPSGTWAVTEKPTDMDACGGAETHVFQWLVAANPGGSGETKLTVNVVGETKYKKLEEALLANGRILLKGYGPKTERGLSTISSTVLYDLEFRGGTITGKRYVTTLKGKETELETCLQIHEVSAKKL